MKNYIEDRVLETANYILETGCTVRSAAKKFGVSKSTVHKDMVDRLPEIKPQLVDEVHEVLNFNKSERHIRGGMSTREKYQKNHH